MNIFFYLNSLVKSTEAITTNLANQSDFMSLSVIEESVALQAERVGYLLYYFLLLFINF